MPRERMDIITGVSSINTGEVIVEFNGKPRNSVRAEILSVEGDRVFFIKPSREGKLLGVAKVDQEVRESLRSLTNGEVRYDRFK